MSNESRQQQLCTNSFTSKMMPIITSFAGLYAHEKMHQFSKALFLFQSLYTVTENKNRFPAYALGLGSMMFFIGCYQEKKSSDPQSTNSNSESTLGTIKQMLFKVAQGGEHIVSMPIKLVDSVLKR